MVTLVVSMTAAAVVWLAASAAVAGGFTDRLQPTRMTVAEVDCAECYASVTPVDLDAVGSPEL